MQPFIDEHFGNPSSGHWFGMEPRDAVDRARRQVAGLIGAPAERLFFMSCATEANNLAIIGSTLARKNENGHIITSAIEHPAVLDACRRCRDFKADITELPVDGFGMVNPDDVKRGIRPDTFLISIMHANNEVGTIQPIAEIGNIAREHGILFHCDAAQSTGKIPVNIDKLHVDMLSVAGHKLYAPKGIGALYVREGIALKNLIYGGGQEKGLRPGTENIIHIAGLGAACALAQKNMPARTEHLRRTRDRLESRLMSTWPGIERHGHPRNRLPNTANLAFPGLDSGMIMSEAFEVAISAGAACHSGGVEMSHVLKAMGVTSESARGTLRLSTGIMTTAAEIDRAVKILKGALERTQQRMRK
jgi:cysteine desulfurase